MSLSTGPHRIRARRGLILVLLAGAGLTGCASTVTLEPAGDATNPLCAEVMVRLPDTVGELNQRQTNAQATSAWGTPATVTLRCGVPVPGPTTTLCVEAGGVDWIADETQAPVYRFTTYGREPAIEVLVNQDTSTGAALVTGRTALEAVAAAVGEIPQSARCL